MCRPLSWQRNFQRFNPKEHFAELSRPAGLLLVAMMALGLHLDRLAIGDLRRLGIDLHAAVFHFFQHEAQVQLA